MKMYTKSGSHVDVHAKAEANALLSTKGNLMGDGALTAANVYDLQTDARPLTSSVNTKTEG